MLPQPSFSQLWIEFGNRVGGPIFSIRTPVLRLPCSPAAVVEAAYPSYGCTAAFNGQKFAA